MGGLKHAQPQHRPNGLQRALRSVVRGLFGIDFGVPGADTFVYAQDWQRGVDLLRPPEAVDKPYLQVGPYQRVVSVIARDSAAVPWELFRVDANGEPGDDPIPNHPVSQLWQKPNGYTVGNQLFIGSYIHKLVFGEWIWWYPDLVVGKRTGVRATERSGGGIQLLFPPNVARKLENDGTISYKVRIDGNEVLLDPRRVTHSRRYNPYSPVHGLPLAGAIIADLLGYHAAAQWNARWFNEQNALPTMVMVPMPGMMNQADDRTTFLRRWKQQHGSRGVGMVPGGWDVKEFGVTQKDMDFAELRQFGRDEILAAAGVPPLIAGYLTRPITYNASEQKQLYWQSTISNFVTEEQAVLNADFLPKVGVTERVFPKWEVVKALLENLNEKADVAQKLFAMGFTKRQINERLELGFDVDELEDPDVGYLPFSLMPVSLLSEARSVTGTTEDAEGDDAEEQPEKSLALDLRETRRTLAWRRIIAGVRDIEARFNSVLRSHMHDIETEVLGNLAGLKGWMAARRKDDEGVSGVLFDSAKAKVQLQKVTAPLHREALKRGGEGIMLEIGMDIDFTMSDPVVTARLTALTGKIVGIDETIEHDLRAALAEGLLAGESPQQLAARVRDVMKVSRGRSMTIARTETGFAHSAGRDAGMRQAGVEKHEWLTARDDRVRDSHLIDGEVRALGEPFSNGLQRPLDPNAAPEDVIQCRCAAVPVLEAAS